MKRNRFRDKKLCQGFSLMELAIVLMIIGTLMSGVLVAVGQSTANARITNAKAQLREVEEALYGYAQAHGRLPCPTTPTSAFLGFEDPIAGTNCTEWHGFVPYATLGLAGPVNDDGLLLDPWQNPIRYSVASYAYGGVTPSFTNAAALDTLFNTAAALTPSPTGFVDHDNMLQVCDNSACTGNVYVNSAPAVVLSMGANWATYSSADEQQNAGDGSTTLSGINTYRVTASNEFVSTTYSEDNFDDQLVWISPYVLFNRLVSAGKLP
jgi:prepilin-type N-terminal cleavage/methylation domain-containing protein